MALPAGTRDAVDAYARQHLDGGLDDHVDYFDFLGRDAELQRRVGEEYYSARYLYKLFEGMRIDDDWARRAQIQIQVQQYASIYEACIHHLLFVCAPDHPATQALLKIDILKRWSVSADLRARLNSKVRPGEREVVAAVQTSIKVPVEKVRFDSKANAAATIGIIDNSLAKELIRFYAARNMIHIHAELKKGNDWSWEMEFSKQAYWRLSKFSIQARAWVNAQQ